MRNAVMQVIVTFHTTAEAMATEAACKARGFPGRLIPAPRSLSADCGLAWSSPAELRPALEQIIKQEKIEIAGICEMLR